jgi:hypothetical protein
MQAHHGGMHAQKAVGHGVKGPGPGQGAVDIAHASGQPGRPSGHLGGRAPGKGEQQNAPRIHAAPDERRHSMRQGLRLAGAGTRDHEQRPVAVLDRGELGRIQRVVLGADLHPANTTQMFS